MSVHESLARLNKAAGTLEDWARPTFGDPATADAIANLRAMAGFPLPAGLEALLSTHESICAMDIHNGYWIGGLEQLANSGLPRRAQDEAAVPIATDGGGNAFLLSSSGRVWRWDHETDGIALIAANVEAFLERVAADWEAIVAGTPGWQFIV